MNGRVAIQNRRETESDPVPDAARVSEELPSGDAKRTGGNGLSRLAAIAAGITTLPAGNGYIYITGEPKMVSQSGKHFQDARGFDKSRIEAIGYWIEGQSRG